MLVSPLGHYCLGQPYTSEPVCKGGLEGRCHSKRPPFGMFLAASPPGTSQIIPALQTAELSGKTFQTASH